MKQTQTNFSLKDQLFNKDKVQHLAGLIFWVYPEFNKTNFIEDTVFQFPELELKQRIHHIRDMLKKYLDDDFEASVNILIASLPVLKDNGTLDNNFWDFIFAPYCDYIRKYGCNKADLEFSLSAQAACTWHASAEDSIRYFLNDFEDETFDQMLAWSSSDNYFLRRLASEWTRPKLPWCQKINLDYNKPIAILDNLYTDPSRFVTRSVANHLNDIAKIEPKLVTDTLKRWKQSVGNDCIVDKHDHANKINNRHDAIVPYHDLDYIISHATRTLVKFWDPATLELLWYSPEAQVTVQNFKINNTPLTIPDYLNFSFDIVCESQQNLIIDYKIYFISKNWKLLPKVFKIKKWAFKWTQTITKKHLLKLMTTKALYPWEHFVEIVINGKSFGKESFELQA